MLKSFLLSSIWLGGAQVGFSQAIQRGIIRRELQGSGIYQNNNENRTVADLGSSFRPGNLQPSLLPYTSPYAMTLVQQTQKMEELIKLVKRHNTPQTAHKIIGYNNMRLTEGDDGFLNDKLKQTSYGR